MRAIWIDRHQRRQADPQAFHEVTIIQDLRELLDF